jgi:hypothetical protein
MAHRRRERVIGRAHVVLSSNSFEAESTLFPERVDTLFDARGRLHEEEADTAASELPAAVRSSAMRSTGGKGSMVRAEPLPLAGTPDEPRFEVMGSLRGVRGEHVDTADGRPLKPRP